MATIGNWAYVLKSKLAVASARRGEDPLKLAHRVRHLGDAYYHAGRWELGQEAHDLYVSLNVSAGIAESAARLALLARRHGDLARSRACLIEASTAADAAHDPETLQYIRNVTSQLAT